MELLINFEILGTLMQFGKAQPVVFNTSGTLYRDFVKSASVGKQHVVPLNCKLLEFAKKCTRDYNKRCYSIAQCLVCNSSTVQG